MASKKTAAPTANGAVGKCPSCGIEGSVVNRHWIWKEPSGALHSRPLMQSEIGANDEPKPLQRCPQCGTPIPPETKSPTKTTEP